MTRSKAGLSGALVFAWAAAAFASEDWPNFRGPRHDGISLEKGFQTVWKEPLPRLWERQVGSSFSSFACAGERVFTCGTVDNKQTIFALHADTGNVVWQKSFEENFPDEGRDGTRATPTVDGDRVYVLSARGLLLCLDAATGSEIWRRQFGTLPRWGYSGSVLIEGDLAIVSAGEKDGALLALDKKTGQQQWSCGNDPVGYATPYPFTFQGTRYIAGFTAQSAIIAEAATGREVFRHGWITDYKVNAAAPIFHDGHLFLGSGYTTGSGLLKLRRDGDRLAADLVWENKVLMPKFQSAILHQGKLYCSDQKAMVCADFLTGKELWRKRRMANGTIILADGHLLLLTESGQLQIAPVDPKDFQPVTDVQLFSDRCWSVPVLFRGRLYARDQQKVACFDLKSQGKP